MSNETQAPTKLLWMDLEFTDFDYPNSLMLEVSVKVTDFNFKPLATYEARIKNDPDRLVERFKVNSWWQGFPHNRDDFIRNNNKGKDTRVVEQELIAFVDKHFGDEQAILAGNSIHSDRGAIRAHWPQLDLKLHYRMLDVSAFKIVMQGKYDLFYEKDNTHRATDDIEESIKELAYYLDWFKGEKSDGGSN